MNEGSDAIAYLPPIGDVWADFFNDAAYNTVSGEPFLLHNVSEIHISLPTVQPGIPPSPSTCFLV